MLRSVMLGALALIFLMGWYVRSVLSAQRTCSYIVDYDVRFSTHARKKIYSIIKQPEHCSERLDHFTAELIKQFPSIENVTIERLPHDIHIMISSVKPLAVLNDFYIVDERGRLNEVMLFSVDSLRSLPHFYFKDKVSVEDCLHQLFITFLKNLDIQVATRYRIEWHDSTAIELQSDEHKDIFLISGTVGLDKRWQAHSEALRKRVRKQGQLRGGQVIDLRFKNQIIVYPVKKLSMKLPTSRVRNSVFLPNGDASAMLA